jgi:hypothetical protein
MAASAAVAATMEMAFATAVLPVVAWVCVVAVVFMFCLHTGLIGIPGLVHGRHTSSRFLRPAAAHQKILETGALFTAIASEPIQ